MKQLMILFCTFLAVVAFNSRANAEPAQMWQPGQHLVGHPTIHPHPVAPHRPVHLRGHRRGAPWTTQRWTDMFMRRRTSISGSVIAEGRAIQSREHRHLNRREVHALIARHLRDERPAITASVDGAEEASEEGSTMSAGTSSQGSDGDNALQAIGSVVQTLAPAIIAAL